MHPAVLLGFVLLPGLLKITNEDVRLARFLAPIRPPAYPPTHPHPPAPHPTHQRPAKTCRYRAALSMSSRSSPQGHRSRSAARAVQTFKFVCYFHPRSAAPLPHMIKKIRFRCDGRSLLVLRGATMQPAYPIRRTETPCKLENQGSCDRPFASGFAAPKPLLRRSPRRTPRRRGDSEGGSELCCGSMAGPGFHAKS